MRKPRARGSVLAAFRLVDKKMEALPKLISKFTLYTHRAHVSVTQHIPFVLLYSFVLYHCFLTMGEPYNTRIAELRVDGRLNETHITPEEISTALEVIFEASNFFFNLT